MALLGLGSTKMSAVLGWSTGCGTCRRRKKGCDKNRPVCNQCVKSGLECVGYPKKDRTTEQTSRLGIPRRRLPSLGGRQNSSNITLAHTLTQSAYSEKYLGIFWSEYLPGGRNFPEVAVDRSPGCWTSIVQVLRTSDRSLNLATLALSLCFAGDRAADPSLIQKGIEAYGRSMLLLGTALRDPTRTDTNALLGTSILLEAFEIFFGSGKSGDVAPAQRWAAHARGQLAIILSQPPEAYQLKECHKLFTDVRYFTLLESVKCRKRWSLLSPEWMSVPWEYEPKSAKDKLIDIIGATTPIMEDADSICTIQDPVKRELQRQQAIADCWRIDGELQKWCVENGPLKSFQDKCKNPMKPTSPEDFALGHITILCWTACMSLYSQLRSLDPDGVDGGLPNPLPYAQRIAHALPFLLNKESGFMGATLAAGPLWMITTLPSVTPSTTSREGEMLSILMASRQGRIIKKFMRSLG